MNSNFSDSDIHIFRVADRSFLFDVEGGDLYNLSPVAFELASAGINTVSEIGHLTFEKWKAFGEVRKVFDSIRPLTQDQTAALSQRIESREFEMVGLWLGISHSCNLACRYCFANEPEYLGRPRLMSWKVAKQCIDFLLSKSPTAKNFHIIFFGGEPLLNFLVMTQTIDYCRSLENCDRTFSFSVTTNGTLLTPEIYDYLRTSQVSMMLSLDGTREIQDRNRRLRDGSSSWDVIVDNLRGLEDFGEYVAARATLVDTKVGLITIFRSIADLGFKSIALSEVCPNSGSPPIFPAGEIAKWKSDYLSLARYVGSVADSVDRIPLSALRDFMLRLLEKGRWYHCCSTGLSFFYITPEGEIYPCFRMLTKERDFRLGTIFTDMDLQLAQEFRKNHIFNKSCKFCWARYLCGGQCYGDAHFATRALDLPVEGFCIMTKHKIEVAAYILEEFRRRGKLADVSVGAGTDDHGFWLRNLLSR